jgi:hypothetical protein
MQEFRRIDRGVMSNARCLTEGVDVPAVDMVAFLSPKKSKVDIVQAIGRAMRKSPGKEIGYVLVPLYLEQREGETLEEAVARTNFEEVWDILQSLKEQDEVLSILIREMSESIGLGKGFTDNRLSERIEFRGPVLTLEGLRDSITARSLERLESYWDLNFGRLKTFHVEHGHCSVSRNIPYLGNWVHNLRNLYDRRELSQDRITKLNELNFDWGRRRDPEKQRSWDDNFTLLEAFKAEHGHCRVPQNYKTDPSFGSWLNTQRRFYNKDLLPHDRVARLESLGFVWNPHAYDWEEGFLKLKEFKKIYAHCQVTQKYLFNDFKLGQWVSVQRSAYKNGTISSERISRLDELGFNWGQRIDLSKTRTWDENFALLKSFKAEYGHCRVPQIYKYDLQLGRWVASQRANYKKASLSSERISLLESLGFFNWGQRIDLSKTRTWDENFALLKSFKAEYGHCRVPQIYKYDLQLGRWVASQRANYKKASLSSERISLLESLGFDWGKTIDPSNKRTWDENFSLLEAFKVEHGHCRVPVGDETLGRWITTQRSYFTRGKLLPERITSVRL